jgi:hypothetical protein
VHQNNTGNNICNSWPHWILVQIKLKFWRKKLFALLVTNIIQWKNFEITIEATLNML